MAAPGGSLAHSVTVCAPGDRHTRRVHRGDKLKPRTILAWVREFGKLGGFLKRSFRGLGGSLGVFLLAQLEQIPIALLFQRLRDRHRVLEKTIVLRGAGLRRERVLARGVLTGLRIPATHLANNALVDGVGQLGDVHKQAFSKPED